MVKQEDQALARVFSGYTISATAWLIFATFIGILLAYKFAAPDFGPGAWLTFGRLRPIHTNATFTGGPAFALVGLANYVAVRSCRTSLYSATGLDGSDLAQKHARSGRVCRLTTISCAAGRVGARTGGADVVRGTARVTFWGALAMAITAAIGTVV